MYHYVNLWRAMGVSAAPLLIVLQFGCARPPAEIPITAASEEARELFIKGREAQENLHADAARKLYSRAIEKDPGFALAYLQRGLAAASTQDRKRDLERATELAERVSEGEQLLIGAWVATYVESNPERWLQLSQELARKYAGDKRAHGTAGSVYYFGRQDYPKAAAEFRQAVALDPEFAPAYNMLGYSYREVGKYPEAEEAFKNYIRLIPDEANPYDSMADLLAKMGRHEEAIEHYWKAVELDPTFAASRAKAGVNLCWLGNYDEGRQAIQKAAEMATTPAGKVANMAALARTYLYEGNPQEALTTLDEVIRIAMAANLPRRTAFQHLARADVCVEIGDLDQAEACLSDCRKVLESADIVPYYKGLYSRTAQWWDAYVAAKRDDFGTALARAEEYKVQVEAVGDPVERKYHHALVGLIRHEQGDHDQAIGRLQQSDQQNPFILYHWGMAEAGAGNQEKAAELFKTAAHWNVDTFDYALVRAKARAALQE